MTEGNRGYLSITEQPESDMGRDKHSPRELYLQMSPLGQMESKVFAGRIPS